MEPSPADSPSEPEEDIAAAATSETAPSAARPSEPPRPVITAATSVHAARIERGRWRDTALIMGAIVGFVMLLLWRLEHGHAAGKLNPARDRPPKLLAESARAALPAALEGTVAVLTHVEAGGSVSETRVEKPVPEHRDIEPRAMAVVHTYRFEPALKGGVPVDGWLTVKVKFSPMPNVRRLTVKGSETIGSALGPAWARALELTHPELQIEVEALGSSTGFAALFDGSADLAASSRAIRPDEESLARKLGITLKSVVAAHDGIAVVVHPSNSLKSLDMATVASVFSGRITRWSQLGMGDAPIRLLGRPSYSGTHGFFRERALSKLGPGTEFPADVTSFESSQALVGRVVDDSRAIGYVSVSHVIPSVRILPIQATHDGPAVAPTPEHVRDGTYPISRPLMLYWRTDASPEALAFVELATSKVGQELVAQNGFVPLAAEEASPDLKASVEEANLHKDEPAKPQSLHVYFEQGVSSVDAKGQSELSTLALELRKGKRAVIVGNSDASGDPTVNHMLARKRAEAVVQKLHTLGVSHASLTVAIADDRPQATNDTPEGRRENRRVDVLVFDR